MLIADKASILPLCASNRYVEAQSCCRVQLLQLEQGDLFQNLVVGDVGLDVQDLSITAQPGKSCGSGARIILKPYRPAPRAYPVGGIYPAEVLISDGRGHPHEDDSKDWGCHRDQAALGPVTFSQGCIARGRRVLSSPGPRGQAGASDSPAGPQNPGFRPSMHCSHSADGAPRFAATKGAHLSHHQDLGLRQALLLGLFLEQTARSSGVVHPLAAPLLISENQVRICGVLRIPVSSSSKQPQISETALSPQYEPEDPRPDRRFRVVLGPAFFCRLPVRGCASIRHDTSNRGCDLWLGCERGWSAGRSGPTLLGGYKPNIAPQ